MPKDTRKPPSKSSDQSRGRPYSNQSEPKNLVKLSEGEKDWEEIRCVICWEPPHNPILLQCTSHEKGCRAYMCHTSPPQPNCLNRFRRSSSSVGLPCPLCRGRIEREVPASGASYINSRPRICSQENCGFSGTYAELTEHAGSFHVGARDDVRTSGASDDVADSNGTRPVLNARRRGARIRVGYYPRHQLASRTTFTN